jgi:hypothetical protein
MCGTASCVRWKKREIDVQHFAEIVCGVVGDRLADEDTGIVDDGVDPSVPVDGGIDNPCCDVAILDRTSYRNHIAVIAWTNVARIRDHCISEISVGSDEASADTLRGTSDNCDFFNSAHGRSPNDVC